MWQFSFMNLDILISFNPDTKSNIKSLKIIHLWLIVDICQLSSFRKAFKNRKIEVHLARKMNCYNGHVHIIHNHTELPSSPLNCIIIVH